MRKAGVVCFAYGKVYLHGDHPLLRSGQALGSASLTTDWQGNKYGELRYKPYGETRYVWGSTPTDRRFTGQRSDAYIKLIYLRARWYHPEIGRWTSPDSIVPDFADPRNHETSTFTYMFTTALSTLQIHRDCLLCALIATVT